MNLLLWLLFLYKYRPLKQARSFIYISLASDLLIAISKFVAAAFTGSASMFSEGIHSIIDATSQLLLIRGVRVSKKLPDDERPFGYGKEFYFWAFVVSLIIFTLGGCLSFYEGIIALKHPRPDKDPGWNYAVLGVAFVFTLISMYSGLKDFNKRRGDISFWKAMVGTKDPSTIIVILGDFGDLLGIVIAALGIYLGRLLHEPYFDAIASMIIGAILVIISGFLVRESKSLLLGETTRKDTLSRIKVIAEADEAVLKIKKQSSVYLAPDEVLLQIDAVFKDELTTQEIIKAISRITEAVQDDFPFIKQLFIEPVN